MEDLIKSFLMEISWNEPLFRTGPTYLLVLLISLMAGAALAILCQIGYGAFKVWGFTVGTLGGHFLWLASVVVAAKYGALMLAAIVYLVWLLKHVDEVAPVYQSELLDAARARNSDVYNLFVSDPEALHSATEALNAGISDPGGFEKALAKAKRDLILGLVVGTLVFATIACVL